MIDEKMLDRWTETLRPALTATFPVDDARELIRLAHLGLWAEKHAIPHLREQARYECYVMCICQDEAEKVLAALPEKK